MLPWQFYRSTEKSESQDFGHDDTKNKRDKNKLQLTDQQQKRESGEFRDKGGTISGFFQS